MSRDLVYPGQRLVLVPSAAEVDVTCTKNATEGGHSHVYAVMYVKWPFRLLGAKFTPEANADYSFRVCDDVGTIIQETAAAAGTSGNEMTFRLNRPMVFLPGTYWRGGIARTSGTGTYPYRSAAVSTEHVQFFGGVFETTYYANNPLAVKLIAVRLFPNLG